MLFVLSFQENQSQKLNLNSKSAQWHILQGIQATGLQFLDSFLLALAESGRL